MLWFKEHKRSWRSIFLVMLIVAMFGPWSFDRISVPLPNTCSFPSIRLDDVLCSSPTPMAWLLAEIPSQLTHLVNGLINSWCPSDPCGVWVALYIAFRLPNSSIPQHASFDHMGEATTLGGVSSCGIGIGSRDQPAERHNWFIHRKLGTVGCMALYSPDGWTAHGGDIGDLKNTLNSCEQVLK